MAPLLVNSYGPMETSWLTMMASVGLISTVLIVLIACVCGDKNKEKDEAAKKAEEIQKPASQRDNPAAAAEKPGSDKDAPKKASDKEAPRDGAKSEQLKSMLKSNMADAKTALTPPEMEFGKGPAFAQNFNQTKKMADALACGPSPTVVSSPKEPQASGSSLRGPAAKSAPSPSAVSVVAKSALKKKEDDMMKMSVIGKGQAKTSKKAFGGPVEKEKPMEFVAQDNPAYQSLAQLDDVFGGGPAGGSGKSDSASARLSEKSQRSQSVGILVSKKKASNKKAKKKQKSKK